MRAQIHEKAIALRGIKAYFFGVPTAGSLEKSKDAAGCRYLASVLNTSSCRSEPYRNVPPGSVRDKAMRSAQRFPVHRSSEKHTFAGW